MLPSILMMPFFNWSPLPLKHPESANALTYLFLQPLSLGGHTLVAFVHVAGAQPADEHLALATVELLQVLVLGADLLSQVARWWDQLMLLQGLLGLVGLQVGLAEGAHTHQAALDRLSLFTFAHVAWHCCSGELTFGSR